MTHKILYIWALLMLFSSCGIISQTRYGYGLKLNIETGLFSKRNKKNAHKAHINKSKTFFYERNDSVFSNSKVNINVNPLSFNDENTLQKDTSLKVKKLKIHTIDESKSLKSKINLDENNLSTNNHDERPLAPNLILALILAFISPFVSIFLAIRAKKIIKEFNYSYKGNGLANVIIILSVLTFILGIISVIFIYSLFFRF
jgi:hypothetical protein